MKIHTQNQGIVPVTGRNLKLATQSPLLKNWMERLDSNIRLKGVEVQHLTVVRRNNADHVLFMMIKADVVDFKNRRLPGVVFLRGPAVGMLIVLKQADNGDEWVVLIESSMPSIGQCSYPQLPAGMMDGEKDGLTVAIREIREETGIKATPAEVSDLTGTFYEGADWPGIYPSPGACDEFIKLFLCRKTMSDHQIRALNGRNTGLAAENEHLKLRVVRLSQLCKITPDVKAHSAFLMYELMRLNPKRSGF